MTGTAVGPSIWVVSDGRAGIERQALSIARALGDIQRWTKLAHIRSEAHRPDPVRLTPKAPQVWLPSNLWPAAGLALPKYQRAQLHAPWPDIWIGSGRRAVPYSRRVRRWSGGKTLVVQTQHPRTSLTPFDLVIPPKHDGLEGPNVLSTVGAPAFFAPDDIEEAMRQFSALGDEPGLKIAFVLGGKSKTHDLSSARAEEIEANLRTLAANGARLWITASRRTPDHARIRFRALAKEIGGRYWESETADGPNPYAAYLAFADAVMVTEDSANMISDAAYFAKPIYLVRLKGRSQKFDRLHKSFIDYGAARWFDGAVEPWSYTALREVDRAADEIVRLMLERFPAPAKAASPYLG